MHSLPNVHAFVQRKMCLAGKELFSVNSYNSSSQTRVLGWAATIPLGPANYCERTHKSPDFILIWSSRKLLAQLPHNSHVYRAAIHKSSRVHVKFQSTRSCEILFKHDGQENKNSPFKDSHSVDEFYLQRCD